MTEYTAFRDGLAQYTLDGLELIAQETTDPIELQAISDEARDRLTAQYNQLYDLGAL